jgi:hypothetical protein
VQADDIRDKASTLEGDERAGDRLPPADAGFKPVQVMMGSLAGFLRSRIPYGGATAEHASISDVRVFAYADDFVSGAQQEADKVEGLSGEVLMNKKQFHQNFLMGYLHVPNAPAVRCAAVPNGVRDG